MKVGVAKAKITPEIGSPLSGYRARSGVSNAIHDDLFSRALAFQGTDGAAILISVDVLALSEQFTLETRKRISTETLVCCDNIMIAATHTHSGPHTIQTFFNADVALNAEYMAALSSAIARSGLDAWQNLTSARLGVGSCQVPDLGANRRLPARGAIDREAAIIRVDHLDGSPMAVAVVYGCHPTVLGPDNLQVTGDFPAATVETLESQLGAGAFALFFNGAEGNISIGRSSELSAIGVQMHGRTFSRAMELGEGLAMAVLAALPGILTSTEAVINVRIQEGSLRGGDFPPVTQLQEAVEKASERAKYAADTHGRNRQAAMALVEEVYAEARYNNARELQELKNIIPMTITGVRIDQAMFLGIPGELFTEIGMAFKSKIYRSTFVIGLANGYIGYLPTTSAYKEGGYEVEVASCAPDSELLLMLAASHLKAMLFPDSSANSEERQ